MTFRWISLFVVTIGIAGFDIPCIAGTEEVGNDAQTLRREDGESNIPSTPPTFRVIVDTDLGGDPDDIQSLFRLIHYSDILKVEAIVSSPGPGSQPKTDLIRHWIQRADVDHLRSRGYATLATEAELLQSVFQGSRGPGAPAGGRESEGSRQIIRCARRDESQPLWVLVWGSMTTLAQAIHDAPEIASRVRIYSIGSSNTIADPDSRDYVFDFMKNVYPQLWWIENGILPRGSTDTFRGVYQGGIQDGEWGNKQFVRQHIRGHGSDHQGLFDEKCGDAFPLAESPPNTLKEGDSPSMLYLLSPVLAQFGDPEDPTRESWGGQFRPMDKASLPNYYIDRFDNPGQCQDTIARWRRDFLSDWRERWDRYD